MKKTQPHLKTLLPGFFLATAPAFAAITYVDALEGASGNTFATGGSLVDTSWQVPGTSGAEETNWGQRAFANNATIFQAIHEVVVSDDMPELTTQITGLADGTYNIWTFYWDQVTSETQNWTIATGLTSGSLTTYSSPVNPPGVPAVAGATTAGVVNAASLTFTNSPLVTEAGNRDMYGVDLGQVTVSGGSVVNVFIDNSIGNGTTNRTWYDGVGYELIPEPSSMLLLGLGGIAFAGRRRR